MIYAFLDGVIIITIFSTQLMKTIETYDQIDSKSRESCDELGIGRIPCSVSFRCSIFLAFVGPSPWSDALFDSSAVKKEAANFSSYYPSSLY